MSSFSSFLEAYFKTKLKDKPSEQKIGVEFEFPIVTLSGGILSLGVVYDLIRFLQTDLGFVCIECDEDHIPIKLRQQEAGDVITFEFYYGTIEFSLAPLGAVGEIERVFLQYFQRMNDFLLTRGHFMATVGVNPYKWVDQVPIVRTHYYQMIHNFLIHFDRYKGRFPTNFNSYIVASQTHLDVPPVIFHKMVNVMSKLSWIKALLFSNSPLWREELAPDHCLCLRDILWEQSAFSLIPSNVGTYTQAFPTFEDYASYYTMKPLFYVQRASDYIIFNPVPLEQYLSSRRHKGILSTDLATMKVVETEVEDAHILLPYTHLRISRVGTLEIRNDCQQPYESLFAPVAFNVGVKEQYLELERLLENQAPSLNAVYRREAIFKGYNSTELPLDLVPTVLKMVYDGIKKRGFGEERYLVPLFERLDQQLNPALTMVQQLQRGASIPQVLRKMSGI